MFFVSEIKENQKKKKKKNHWVRMFYMYYCTLNKTGNKRYRKENVEK